MKSAPSSGLKYISLFYNKYLFLKVELSSNISCLGFDFLLLRIDRIRKCEKLFRSRKTINEKCEDIVYRKIIVWAVKNSSIVSHFRL